MTEADRSDHEQRHATGIIYAPLDFEERSRVNPSATGKSATADLNLWVDHSRRRRIEAGAVGALLLLCAW